MTGCQLAGTDRRRRPGTLGLLLDQVRYSIVELWRSRVVFVFTFLFPLTWLVLLGLLAGNEIIDESTGLRVMQFVTPTAAVMGVLYATLPTTAIGLAVARETGVLKRVRGTPLPAWIYLSGRIGATVVFAVASVITMVLVGVLGYDVQIIWRTVPATAVTIVVAIACFAAAGMAIAGLARSAGLAEAASIATAVVLAFLSGLFMVGGGLPGWADRIASVFPLKAFARALQDQFNPFLDGAGWDLAALALMVGWGVACGFIAARAFRWDPAQPRTSVARSGPDLGRGTAASRPTAATPAERRRTAAPVRPGRSALIRSQVRHALLSAWRDPGWVFFAVAMPIGLFAFLMATNSAHTQEIIGTGEYTLGLYLAAGMITWGAAVTAFINTPEAVVRARDAGVLKRLRGTPLEPGQYLAGRTASSLLIALFTGAVVLAVGTLGFDLQISWAGTGLAVGVLLMGTATFAACGFALAGVLPSSRAVSAVGLAILLPVAFFSDVFIAGQTPSWMSTVGSVLPMKPMANSISAALDPAGPTVLWWDLAVLLGWLVIGTVLAIRTFRWTARPEPTTGNGARSRG